MSTNYYAHLPNGDEIHLGKRSAGWRFAFHATEHFGTVRELTGWLENTPCVIRDEYSDPIGPVEFMAMATSWGQPDGHQHGLNCRCGRDPNIHGPLDSITRSFAQDEYTDGDTDWIRGEFS